MSIEAVKYAIKTNQNDMPNVILEKLRIVAKDRFSTNEYDKREDSMDAALCMYNKSEEKLYFSGGFINLLVVKDNKELIIYNATRCPIGAYPVEHDFELNEIELHKGDMIYLVSDGYGDQYGFDPV